MGAARPALCHLRWRVDNRHATVRPALLRKSPVNASPHTAQAPLIQLLYTSHLAPSARISDMAVIARASRLRNAEQGITGSLVFDGQRFGHYLEGPEAALLGLWQKLREDSRHHQVVLRHHAPLTHPRRFASSSLGYALAQDESALDPLDEAWGEPAVAALVAALACCVREP